MLLYPQIVTLKQEFQQVLILHFKMVIIIDFVVIIPAYNEENSIKSLINRILVYTPYCLVIDDGSSDNTAEISRSAGAKTLQLKHNYGKGKALRIGMIYAFKNYPYCNWIITMDADGQHATEDIPKLVKSSQDHKYLINIGCRCLRTINSLPRPTLRYRSNYITTLFIRKVFNIPIHDLQSGFRIYAMKSLPLLLFGVKTSNFQLETEIILEAWSNCYLIGETPVQEIYFQNMRSHIRWYDAFRWIKVVFLRMFLLSKFLHRRLVKQNLHSYMNKSRIMLLHDKF